MANLTNSGKLITKVEAIDSSIESIEAKIGTVPSGTDIMSEIGAVDDKADGIIDSIGTVPSGSTVMDEIGDVDSDLQGFKTTVEETYATKSEISAAFVYKGTKASYDLLPTTGNKVGDVWNITNADPTHGVKAGDNVAWDGSAWDVLGGVTDLTNYFNKSVDDADDITEGSTHLFLTSSERTLLRNTSGVNTGDQSASDFDIKDLADTTGLRTTWSGKQDAISDLDTIRSNASWAIQASSATFVSNTVSETAATGVVTVTAADNVTVATAETNNKSAIAALGTAHNNLVTRVAAVEQATGSLPFTAKFADASFSNSKTAVLSDAAITATSHISWVVKTGTLAGYSIEPAVEAGKVTFTSSDNETVTLRVLIINEITA